MRFGCLMVIVVGGKTTAGKRIIVVVVAVAVTGWHQIEDKVLFMTITVYQSEIAEDAEGQCAKEVDEQVAHGVAQSNIQVAWHGVDIAVGGEDLCFRDVRNMDDLLTAARVKVHRLNGCNHRVFLHVGVQQGIGAEFEKFPQDADGH